MHPFELASMGFEIPTQFPPNFILLQDNLPSIPSFPSGHEFVLQPSGVSNNSTSDEAEEQQFEVLIDERKRRRMISNRESARRSRMRKQRQIDELWTQVLRLRTENHDLVDKLKHANECHEKVLLENAQLKEETAGLREMITGVQFGSPFDALEHNFQGSNQLPTTHICVSKLEM